MDSLNQTALMNLENKIIFGQGDQIYTMMTMAIPFYIFMMPILVFANYSNPSTIIFELAASVSGKFIFSALSYIYPGPFQIIIYICYFSLKNAFFKKFNYLKKKYLFFTGSLSTILLLKASNDLVAFFSMLLGYAISLLLYSPVFISDLINLIKMVCNMLFGFDSIDYSPISTLTKFLSPLLLMGMGHAIV